MSASCSTCIAMRVCSKGCGRKHYARGLCKPCYTRAWSKGTHIEHAREMVEACASLDERLRHHGWTEVDHDWTPVDTPCWEWNGYRNPRGYGQLAVGRHAGDDPQRSVPMLAPRAAFLAWVGDIPDGCVVCHHCDNPPCINPTHFFLGTRLDNNADAAAKGRTSRGENHGQHKLSDAQVDEIRARYAEGGVYQKQLAAEYGVCQQLISHYVRGTRRAKPTDRQAPAA
jgi:hypothetical protein